MSRRTDVDPAQLRASAGACDDMARTIKGPADKAVKEAGTAGGSLTGWSMGPALAQLTTGWKPALDGLHAPRPYPGRRRQPQVLGRRHEWNDERVSQDFEKTGADTATQATPGVMPAVLRPRTGEPRKVAGAGAPAPLDPRASYGTDMPTCDETVSTRPTPVAPVAPGTDDFG